MKQIKARRTGKPAPSLLSARDLVLAGIGAAAIARREGMKTLSAFDARRREISERIQREIGALGGRVADAAGSVREQIETVAQPAIVQVEGLLSRFGRSPRKQGKGRTARRTRAAKPAARKATRKPARRA